MLATNRLHELGLLGRSIDGVLDAVLEAIATPERTHRIPMQVWLGSDVVVARAELPGVAADAIDLTVDDDVLSLTVERPAVPLADDETLRVAERATGTLTRQLRLPFRVDADAVEAQLRDGVLTLRLPRAEADRPRTIAITHRQEDLR